MEWKSGEGVGEKGWGMLRKIEGFRGDILVLRSYCLGGTGKRLDSGPA